jgi:hypothetical protein
MVRINCLAASSFAIFLTHISYALFFSSASNRIIHAKDHASIQINVADVDEKTGMALPTFKTYAICGSIRRMVILSYMLY